MNTETQKIVLATREDSTKLQDAILILQLRGALKIKEAEARWLDRLADELRDDLDNDESDVLYKEFKEIKKELNRKLSELDK